jgi:alkanesulfonate monooxygenase SsuD/methylene tetrahydromethanopterin reductase-like flavin-dependent oxidoreductase (luciferase family)
VWAAASLSPESFAWIGQSGFKLMATFVLTDRNCLKELIAIYRDAFRAGSGCAPAEVALSLPLYVAPTDAEARREGGRYVARYFEVWEDAARSWRHVQSAAYPGYTYMADVIRASTPEFLQRTGSAVFGCAERVADHVRWLREEIGIDHLLWQVDFGGMPRELAMRTVDAFADEVIPRLADLSEDPRVANVPAAKHDGD